MIVLIAAMGENRVIGVDGNLPWHIAEDLARFKALTMGKPIIMGRATFESIGRPLPGRTNIVLTRNPAFAHEGVVVVTTPGEALVVALRHAGDDGEVVIGGGGQLYRQFLPMAGRMELTIVDESPYGDTTFPEFSVDDWAIESEVVSEGPPCLRYQTLVRL